MRCIEVIEGSLRGSVALLGLLLVAACATSDDGDYAERMSEQHAGDRPVAGAAAAEEPAAAIEEASVEYATVAGEPVTGFLARPLAAGDGAPGVIVIQEWWGLNDNIRSMARRLAGEGYVALAVDLYRGQVAQEPQRARELMQAAMGREAELEENLRQAYGYLKDEQGASRIGVVGWCFGGGWSLRTALLLPEGIDAAVVYYGHLVTDRARLESLRAPILGIFGGEDRGIPVEQVRQFEGVLRDLGKDAEIQIYEGASHAFANPSGTRYDAPAAEDAWNRTLAFFAENLKREAAGGSRS